MIELMDGHGESKCDDLSDLSIIVINYKSIAMLHKLLHSMRAFRIIPGEMIIYDNGSGDDLSCLQHDADFPLFLFQGIENLGFASGCNRAVSMTTKPYILLLNPDTQFQSNCLAPMLSLLKEDSTIGTVGCLLYNEDGLPAQSGEYFHSPRLKIFHATLNILRPTQSRIPYGFNARASTIDVGYVSGADMMVARKLWLMLGGLDERYFMYFEEEDFQLRLSKLGFRRVLLTNQKLLHAQGGSFEQKGQWKQPYWVSYVKYLKKNWGLPGFLMALGIRLWRHAIICNIFKRRR